MDRQELNYYKHKLKIKTMIKSILFISILFLSLSLQAENNKTVVKEKKSVKTELKTAENDSVLSTVVTVSEDTVKVSNIGNLFNDSVYVSKNIYVDAVANVTFFKYEDGSLDETFSPGVGIAFHFISDKAKAAGKSSPIALNIFVNGGAAYSDKVSLFGSVAASLGFVKNKYHIGAAKIFGTKKLIPVVSHKFTF